MKKLLFLFTVATMFVACGPNGRETISAADFPAVIEKIEMRDTTKTQQGDGLYRYDVKKANGETANFTANVRFNVGDTIGLNVDTTKAFARAAAGKDCHCNPTKSDSTSTDSTNTN